MDRLLPSPDELDEPLSGGFAHILIVDGQNLVSWQEFVLRGATCQDTGSALGWPGVVVTFPARNERPNRPQSIHPHT